MRITRQQFDIAVVGSYATAVVASAFASLRLAVPVAVVGALLMTMAFALWDGAGRDER
jgi:hypothetical protein